MSVEFEDQSTSDTTYKSRAILGAYTNPTLFSLVKKLPGVSTNRRAYYVLITIMLLSFMASGAVLYTSFFGGFTQGDPTYIEDIPEDVRKTLPENILRQLPSRNSQQR
ncbi:hypothetical protein KW782_01540 [Candidatus Parcubacteria bacterium]|nr:hypothetical protein [Candidatus Parcubacteria bacterium]